MANYNPLKTVKYLFNSSSPKKIGLPPGSLVHVGEQKVSSPVLSYTSYGGDHYQAKTDVALKDCLELKGTGKTNWINLDGIHDVAQVDGLGQAFGVHPLALEDILNTGHPPKLEEFDDNLLIIAKMFYYDDAVAKIDMEQVSLVLADADTVLTFQERPGDVFAGVRERLKRKGGRIRTRKGDYLAYALIDSIVDSYFHVLGKITDRTDFLETELLRHPSQDLLQQVHQLKGQLILLRKAIWAMREVCAGFLHNESELIDDAITPYLRDLYDHSVQALDIVESLREALIGLVDLYMSSVSQRMNEIMQILTIMASIFIPLTFIAGIYGMNFELMPELKWRYGYPMVWTVMLACVVGMLWFFKRKKWF